MSQTVEEINRRACEGRDRLTPFFREVEKVLVGQRHLIRSLVVGLLTDGHILLEGVPALAKTLAVRTVARALQLEFRRMLFTPGLRRAVDNIYVDDKVKGYIVDLVQATRRPGEYGLELTGLIQYGASPRATIALVRGARAQAFLDGRGYVTPQDVKTAAPDVLRHRL